MHIIPVLEIDLPLRVKISKNKQLSLNLNQYRNTHYQELNTAKKNFYHIIQNKEICTRLGDMPIHIGYKIYMPTRAAYDIMNVASICDKFACDSLVNLGVIQDDNFRIVKSVLCQHSAIDKNNPRCVMSIYDYEDVKPLIKKFLTLY